MRERARPCYGRSHHEAKIELREPKPEPTSVKWQGLRETTILPHYNEPPSKDLNVEKQAQGIDKPKEAPVAGEASPEGGLTAFLWACLVGLLLGAPG